MADRRRRGQTILKTTSFGKQSEPIAFSGKEAFSEVAKANGESIDRKSPVQLLSGRSPNDDEDCDSTQPIQSRETETDSIRVSTRKFVEPQLSGNYDLNLPQRKKVKVYGVGEYVEIWSAIYENWITDGEVIETVDESCIRDGQKVRVGSMKVLYMNRERCKWVPPQLAEECLRASPAPFAPDVLTGKLLKAVNSEVAEPEWRVVYVQLFKGFIQWWVDEDAARRGDRSLGHVHLPGSFFCCSGGNGFVVRAAGRAVTIDAFKAPSQEDAAKWVDVLWDHAGYCYELDALKHLGGKSAPSAPTIQIIPPNQNQDSRTGRRSGGA